MNPFQPIGRAVLALLAEIGRVALFLKDGLAQGLTPTFYGRQILEQMWRIGYNSLPVVGLTAFFGLIIAVMGCYHGFNSKGGAQGVGRATTNAVVSASILILAANFVLTNLLFSE